MRLATTSEAKAIATFALNFNHAIVLIFNTIIATLVWTPTHVFVVISISFAEPLHVSFQIFILEIFEEFRVRNDQVAHVLRTHA
jgi:hypothetical protein